MPVPPHLPAAFLEGIGPMELMLVMVMALLLFGGKGLPGIARGLGRAVREFKKATSEVETEIKRAMDTEEPPPRPRLPATPAAEVPPPTPPPAAPPPPTEGNPPAA